LLGEISVSLTDLALSTSSRLSRTKPTAKNPPMESIAGRPDPVELLTNAKTSGPQIAANFEKTE
jgi:hypothetical protein